jgi:hypothetical protein
MGALFSRNDICVGGDLSFRLEEDLVFFVDYCPQFDPHILLNCIGLAPHMETTIDTFCEENQLRGNCIGIHIRMTDAMPTHPLDRLANRIQRIPLTDPQIFLATDSDTAREYVQSKYSNVIMVPQVQIDLPQGMGRHYYAHRLGFESLAEVIFRESIMDMFLLAQCEYLIAQQNSSFSRVSAVLRDKPSHVSYW